MYRTVTLRLDEASYQRFAAAAEAENRSIANLIQTAALAHLREREFADDYEMAEIRSNESLLERLKVGSEDASQRRGRFVS